MNLQFLKYFITLAEYKNFTISAEKNFVVQSTFSAGIKKLEEALDAQLFYRDKRNVNLTAEGELLLPKAKEILSLWNTIEADFKSEKNKILKIGVLNTIHHTDIVVPILKKFKELYKSYHFELAEDSQNELLHKLKKNEIDVIFIQDTEIDEKLFDKRFVFEENLEVIVSKTHELSDRKQLKLAELDNVPFIEHGSCVLSKKVKEEFKERGYTFNKVFNAQHSDMLTSLVASDLGISLMAKPKKYPDTVAFVPLADIEFKRDIVAVWKLDNKSNELQCFLSV